MFVIDAEFRSIVASTSIRLASNEINTAEAGDIFSTRFKAHLERHEILKEPKKPGSGNATEIVRRTSRIEKASEHLRKMKNTGRKNRKQDRSSFNNLIRAHNKVKKACDKLADERSLRVHERAFRSNPWHYAKKVCTDKSPKPTLDCSQESAYTYFAEISRDDESYSVFPSWVAEVQHVPEEEDLFDFDLTPITPSLVKKVLKKRPSGSAPGDDGITYHHLKMMPSTHHFLATLFSKILLQSQSPPSSWCQAKVITIHKKGDSQDPANFRPIALTSVIGKLHHKILACRLEDYLTQNSIIDKSLQKGFLRGVNGCIEHVFAVQSMMMLVNAQEHSQPLALSFIDLRNAFGSISHAYINDIMKFLKLPPEFTKYVRNLYSSLSALISTKDWKTQPFSISKGVFQGDTLSPLLFLIAFNPIIQSVETHPSKGYAFSLSSKAIAGQQAIPCPGSYIYALWDERGSDEDRGWYLAKVMSVQELGDVTLKYRKGGLTEDVNLLKIKWIPAKGNGKWFLPRSCDPPSYTSTPTIAHSKPHKVKGYADDLTIISSTPAERQEVITHVDNRCKDVCLNIRPDKCHSLLFDGKAACKGPVINVGGGTTSNIKEKCTTFLGSIFASNAKARKKACNDKFAQEFTVRLKRLDSAPIRGEYKVWIYRRYVVPSLHYELSVNGTSIYITKKLNSLATRFVKRWLGLCRSTTVAVIHHPSVLNIQTLESYSTSAKISYLAAVTISPDPMIKEISHIALSNNFGLAHGISDIAREALVMATESIEVINKKTLPRAARTVHVQAREDKWDLSLDKLSVQRKFRDACSLENENGVWNRIMGSLPPGQLSFLLRAVSDTLPTPLNLRRWRFRTDFKCHLCGSVHPTVLHILNACPTALNQGRFTWRHDSVLNALVHGIRSVLPKDEKLYADLPGLRACDNPPATVPQNIVATSARPDMVIIREKKVLLVELTVPYNSPESLRNARKRKETKENYQLLLSELDSLGFTASLTTLEIGALGHSLPQAHSDIKHLVPYLEKKRARQLFDDAGRISITCSHALFRARSELTWNDNRSLQILATTNNP